MRMDSKRYHAIADRIFAFGMRAYDVRADVARVALMERAYAGARRVPVLRATFGYDAFARARMARRRSDLASVAERILDRASACSRLHSALCAEYDAQYGAHGPIIAGVHRDYYPPAVKDRLRRLARSASASGFAFALWRAAGRTLATYRRAHDARAFGFYG